MKIERLLGILFYIINRDNVSANNLAEHFNVSRRTIIRETYEKIKHIYSDKNNNYSLNIDFSIVDENRSIISYISMLKEAIQHNKTVSFQYTNLNSKTRIVKCNIIHVFYKWYSWYAFGYDLEKSDFRMFKIVRMRNLEISETYFDNDYDVAKLLDDYEEKRDKDNMYVTIEYSKEVEALINEYFHGNVSDVLETSIVEKVTIKENDFIMLSIILGFGEKIKVLSPLSYSEKNNQILEKALSYIDKGILVGAICGATLALADLKVLNKFKHTSNSLDYLTLFSKQYSGKELYVNSPAVVDSNLITASSAGGLLWAKYIIQYLNVFPCEIIESRYNYYSTGDPKYFTELILQSI